MRQLLVRVRAELDKANPNTILFTEGEAGIAREFTDGFVTHSSFWNDGTFTEPLSRFIYPQMRAFESWGYSNSPQPAHIFNAVNEKSIYAHNSHMETMAPLSLETRHYYDAYPEITDAPMPFVDPVCTNCLSRMFEGPHQIVTVGNPSASAMDATVNIPSRDNILFDRVSGARIPIQKDCATLRLAPWQFVAFELCP